MGKIIVVTFAFMAFAFYELSGGDKFVPIADEKRAMLAAEEEEKRIAEAAAKAEREKKLAASRQNVTQPVRASSATAELVLASATVPAAPVVESSEVAAAVVAALEADKAEAVTEEAVVADAAEPEPQADIREVTAARVNMRGGPGQNFAVLAKLSAGDEVEILQDPGDGWVKLRTLDEGRVGWMADFLLTASNN